MFSELLQNGCAGIEHGSSEWWTKHSTSVPFNSELAVPLNVDEKEVPPVVSNPVPVLAMKGLPEPQG